MGEDVPGFPALLQRQHTDGTIVSGRRIPEGYDVTVLFAVIWEEDAEAEIRSVVIKGVIFLQIGDPCGIEFRRGDPCVF